MSKPEDKPEDKLKQIETIKNELKDAKEALKLAQDKVNQKRDELNTILEKAFIPFFYDMRIEILEKLCKSKTPVNGVIDLFRRALILRDSRRLNNDGSIVRDGTNEIRPKQYSIRIKKQGMRAIQEYCVIDKASPRIFYIKSMKDLSIKSGLSVNLKELNRELEIAKKKKELMVLQGIISEASNGTE